ncbi:hypothetical protein ACFYPZ_23045 [Streptomyces sp. NPDC005506]|uniref:hypothetical protein n=1 Tax=unclassified Streptomyces TaxID=2593676 RepID=UPI0036C50756
MLDRVDDRFGDQQLPVVGDVTSGNQSRQGAAGLADGALAGREVQVGKASDTH